MALRHWLIPAATGIAGLAVGLVIGNGDAGPPASPDPASQPLAVVRDGPGPAQISLDDLRRVVREEIAALPHTAPGTPAARAGEEPSTGAQSAAAIQAQAVLDSALSRRSWTAADGEAMREDFLAMSDAQRDQWLQKFSQAVNQGRLVPESERLPF